MYLKVQLCRNVHTLLSLFNQQMEFDKKPWFFMNNVIFHRKPDFKKLGVLICYSY